MHRMAALTITRESMGSMISRMICPSEAPSMRAASTIPLSILCMLARKRIRYIPVHCQSITNSIGNMATSRLAKKATDHLRARRFTRSCFSTANW